MALGVTVPVKARDGIPVLENSTASCGTALASDGQGRSESSPDPSILRLLSPCGRFFSQRWCSTTLESLLAQASNL